MASELHAFLRPIQELDVDRAINKGQAAGEAVDVVASERLFFIKYLILSIDLSAQLDMVSMLIFLLLTLVPKNRQL